MIGYVDAFVLPVPRRRMAAYRRLAKLAARVWKDHGALQYRECVGHDLAPGYGLPFPKLVRPRKGEVILFSWIGYRNRAHRDRVNAKVMADPRLAAACDAKNMPFDLKRMACGGFEAIVGF